MKSAGAELVKMNEVFNELEVLISAILSDIELEASSESAPAQRDDTVALQRRAAQLLSIMLSSKEKSSLRFSGV